MTGQNNTNKGLTVLQLGFRPFFLLAGISGALLIFYWVTGWPNPDAKNPYYPAAIWHAHEMLFGYTVAVISGFLLTSVRNWTGLDTAKGNLLITLCLVWLSARVFALLPLAPHGLIALTDLVFLPALAVSLIRPLWGGKNKTNRVFVLILFTMAIANGLVHNEMLGNSSTASRGITLMLDLIVVLILMISGRVMPFFTNMAIQGTTAVQHKWVERSTIGLMIALTISHQFMYSGWLDAGLAFTLCILQLIRVIGWYHHGIWRKPVLWVLYTAYAWIVVGFALSGLSALNLYPENLAIHAFTIGVIGTFTLGMMARVSLGHTGRAMRTSMPVNLTFAIVNIASLIRVFSPVLWPEYYELWIQLSSGLWIAAFLLFTIIYLPILIQPRTDGKPG